MSHSAVLDPPVVHDQTPPRPAAFRAWAIGIVLVGVVASFDLAVPVLRQVAGLSLLVLPVVLLARKLEWRLRPGLVRTIHAASTVVLGLIVGGLVLNTLGRLVGVSAPLSPHVTVPLMTLADLGLLVWRREREPAPSPRTAFAWMVRPLSRTDLPVVCAALGLVLAGLGAVRLNNNAGPSLAVAGMVFVGLAFAALLVQTRTSGAGDPWTVYLVSLALLLGTSLRGWFITGHDIQREYIVYTITHTSGLWDMNAYPNPFNACLSITILPTIVVDVTGLSGLIVFKVLAPMLFAMVPVLVYTLGRRLVSRHLAILGALFTVSFPTFFTDMPFLVRQQLAFLFLAMVVLIATHAPWSRRTRLTWVTAMSAGMVLSHYSTTYLFAGTLLLGLVVRLGFRVLRRRSSEGAPPFHLLVSLPFAIVVAAMSLMWTGPATHTGGHFEEVIASTAGSLIHGTSTPSSSDVKYGLFSGKPEPAQQRLNSYSDSALKASAQGRAQGALVPISRPDERPRAIPHETAPPTVLGRAVDSAGLNVVSLVSISRDSVAKVVQVLLIVGTAGVALGAGLTRRFSADLRCLTIATTGAIVLLVLAPGLSADYGVLRAFQQGLLVMAPTVAVGLALVCQVLGRHARAAVNAVALMIYGILVALVPFAFGGYQPPLNLADEGLYYDLYYSSPEEVAGIRWLDRAVTSDPVQSEVVTDRYNVGKIAALRGTSAGTNDEFFPTLLRRDSYVYAGANTVRRHRAAVFFSGDLLEYRYPVRVLDQGKDRVYDNGYARIYR